MLTTSSIAVPHRGQGIVLPRRLVLDMSDMRAPQPLEVGLSLLGSCTRDNAHVWCWLRRNCEARGARTRCGMVPITRSREHAVSHPLVYYFDGGASFAIRSSARFAKCSYSAATLSIISLEMGSLICSAIVRASIARARQCVGSLR
jgi:hypothetical protein